MAVEEHREAMSGRVDEFEARLATVFGRVPDGGTHRLELRRAGDDDVSITRVLCDAGRAGSVEQPTHHLLVAVGDGDATFTADDGEVFTASPEVPVLLRAGTRYSYVVTGTRLALLQISDQLLQAAGTSARGARPDRVMLSQPRTEEDCRSLLALIRDAGHVISGPSISVPARIRLHDTIANHVLSVLTADTTAAPSGLFGHVATADSLIRRQLPAPVAPAELAAAARISLRTLQQAFQEQLDQTPTEYVRAARLDLARDALAGADADATVTSVAVACGFRHLGRFAAAYSERFGEQPRDTLRHGRQSATRIEAAQSRR
ncbi:helix-turn-helix domain-containing protein [Curtobacterium sp. MCJR17_020]|uniref:helix-turn-helix domain-containing protein n=1 Tax=Curtobacterium sp. MCJR17_020 TaxID=2175619 RepID=UPI000DA7ECAE|nr:helix-turn-helix domain-containing protein [Curtobacterium sp. MCJR17_020]WIE74088.1 helix-turn-helix domain-containing protein [Curtobacterium sp. MCJR17_020]